MSDEILKEPKVDSQSDCSVVVCAANRLRSGLIVCGARHHDAIMNAQLKASGENPFQRDGERVSLTLSEARIIVELVHTDGYLGWNKIRDGLVKKVRPVFEELKKQNATGQPEKSEASIG